MKKFVLLICLAAFVLMAIPGSGQAATKPGDWDLGGYIKLETFWDSTQMGKNLNTPALRRNAVQPNRVGRLNFTSQSTRFNFTIRGPSVFGAKTVGYIEMDFDQQGDARQSASNSYIPRMRHAWFRMDWPGGWSLLMGQYWGMFCNFYPETIQDGPFQFHGQATQRIPQIRLSYKTGPWTFSGLVGKNYDPSGDNVLGLYANNTLIGSQAGAVNVGGAALTGQRSNFPQFGGQVQYEKDLWGKAGSGGRPRGFVANVSAGITRINYQGGSLAGAATWGGVPPNIGAVTFRGDQYDAIGAANLAVNNQTLIPWVVQATLFIPLMTTTTQNLKNTANITAQFYIGQGLSFIGNDTDANNSWFRYDNPGNRWSAGTAWAPGVQAPIFAELNYRRQLTKKYGGYIQGQYYFNNQWYVSYAYGFAKPYGVSQSRNGALPFMDVANIEGYDYASLTDQTRMWQEHCATLFYRPIKAFKFGLGYSFVQTDYFQITSGAGGFGTATANGSYRQTRTGQNHSVRFAGWFFF
jgi:hypothetical protein